MPPVRATEATQESRQHGRLARLEARHFWFAGRRALVARLIERHGGLARGPVLDLGSGTGFTTRALARRGYRVVGVDLHHAASAAPFVQADATRLPFRNGVASGALALDVLEHTDDRQALSELARVLKPGALAIVSVPAVPWLWSARDRVAGHRRRYRRAELRSRLEDAGLRVLELRHYQALLFPLVAAVRIGRRWDPEPLHLEERIPEPLNAFLTAINRGEVAFGDIVGLPWGSSLVAACRMGS